MVYGREVTGYARRRRWQDGFTEQARSATEGFPSRAGGAPHGVCGAILRTRMGSDVTHLAKGPAVVAVEEQPKRKGHFIFPGADLAPAEEALAKVRTVHDLRSGAEVELLGPEGAKGRKAIRLRLRQGVDRANPLRGRDRVGD